MGGGKKYIQLILSQLNVRLRCIYYEIITRVLGNQGLEKYYIWP